MTEHQEWAKAYGKRYRAVNRMKIADYGKTYRQTHARPAPSPEKKREYGSNYYRKHREAILDRLKNDPAKRLAVRVYGHKWRAKPMRRLSGAISRYLRYCLGKNKAGRHWEILVGYTISELKAHLERQFLDGMSWENYGEWEIDHIRPIASFTFSHPDDDDFKQCWSLGNLQPLWRSDNRSKGATVDNRNTR